MLKCVLFLLVLLASTLSAQEPVWLPANGPEGADIRDLLDDRGSTLFAATGRGVFRSSDRGRTWSIAEEAVRDSTILELARIPSSNTILAMAIGGTVLRTTDAGGTWQQSTSNGGWNTDIVRVGSSLFMGASYGVHVSTDDGVSWTLSPGSPHYVVDIMTIADTAIVVASMDQGLNVTRDAGSTWQRLTSDDIGWLIDLQPTSNPSEFYVASRTPADTERMIYRTTDGGVTWTREALPARATVTTLGINAEGAPVAGTSVGIVARDAASGLWSLVAPPPASPVWVSVMTPSDAGEYFAVNSDGVFRTTDDGVTWERSVRGMNAATVFNVAAAPNGDVYAQSGHGLYRSTDLGASWDRTSLVANGSGMMVTPSGTLLVDANGLHRSTDHGATWTRPDLTMAQTEWILVSMEVAPNGDLWVMGPGSGLLRSTDDGVTWELRSDSARFGRHATLTIAPNGDLVTLSPSSHLQRSSDLGATWTQIGESFDEPSVMDFSQAGVLWLGYYQASYFDAASRMSVGVGPTEIASISDLLGGPDSSVYVATIRNGVLRRESPTAQWDSLNDGLVRVRGMYVTDLAMHPSGILFAALKGGGVQRTSEPVSRIDGESSSVRDVSIAPQPATSALTVHLTRARRGDAAIVLRDLQGRVVYNAVRTLDAGDSIIELSVDRLSSGTYLLEIVGGGDRATTLVKVVR
jgi:photosystem II stability/assembly factor-like uncharacterized protein